MFQVINIAAHEFGELVPILRFANFIDEPIIG